MKKLILLCIITILFSLLMFFQGCGCGQEAPANTNEEKPVNVLDPDFKGPNSPPFSVGPTEPPPSLQ